MNDNNLKKTNLFQIILGLIFTNLKINNKYFSYCTPSRIGKYKLLREIEKENGLKNFAIGIYHQGSKKVFIKTWYGVVKDLSYHSLVTEYCSNKVLYRIFNSKRYICRGYRLHVPKIIGYRQTRNSFSLIFEFVQGKTLSTFDQKNQVELLFSTLLKLQEISHELTQKDKQYFRRVSGKFYTFSLPFLTLLTVFSKPLKYKSILKAFFDCVKSARSTTLEKLTLAHRDFEPHNFIVSGLTIYLVDFERMALTVPDYDVNHLSLKPNYKTLAKELFEKMNLKPNKFLKNYIAIQFAAVHNDPKFGNFYLKTLGECYA